MKEILSVLVRKEYGFCLQNVMAMPEETQSQRRFNPRGDSIPEEIQFQRRFNIRCRVRYSCVKIRKVLKKIQLREES